MANTNRISRIVCKFDNTEISKNEINNSSTMFFCISCNGWNNKFFDEIRINEEDCSIKEKEQKVLQNEKALAKTAKSDTLKQQQK